MLKLINQNQKLQLKIYSKSRVFGYARVSTYYQKEYRVSIEAQQARILKYCELHKLSLQMQLKVVKQSKKDLAYYLY